MTKRHTTEALRIAKAVRRKKYADGGAAYLFSDKWRDYLAKKGEQVASLPSEVANMASSVWQHPLSQAMRTSPGETSKAIGEYAYDLGKQGIDYASERPFSAARKAIDFATDWSMDPRVMVAKGIFSSTPANAGEDEFARQVQYGIRPAPETEAPQYANGGNVIAKAFNTGSIKKLMQQIENERGISAARRLERAADEIPNLEKLYTPSALREAFVGPMGDESLLMTMRPEDFKKFASPLTEDLKIAKEGTPEAWNAYVRSLSQLPETGGFSSVPHLTFGEIQSMPAIVGHEGRHRSLALEGINEPASLVRLEPSYPIKSEMVSNIQERLPYWKPYKDERLKMMFSERLPEDLHVVPQGKSLDDYQKVALPEPYKNGGRSITDSALMLLSKKAKRRPGRR
jgi:hypothetical protein